MSTRFHHATRLMHGVTASAEKRALWWLAARLPARIHSDHFTALGAVAMAGAAAANVWAREWPPALHLVNLCLVVNWFGDSLDGTVARVRDQQRPRYGFYIDHVLDCAGIALLVAGMAAGGLLSWPLALGVLVAYFLVSIEVYLATYCLAAFRMSFLGFGPTELRLLVMAGNLAALWWPVATVWGATRPLFDAGAVVAIPLLISAFLTGAVRNGRALFAAEPRPSARSSRYAAPPPSSGGRLPPAPAETRRESPA
jgi:archaetidylinositol phosphate synthase